MLSYVRKNVQNFVVKLILVIVIAAFVGTIFLVWGMGGEEGLEKGNLVARVNDQVISLAQYNRAYENKRQFYRNVYKERFTPEMEKQLNLRQKTLEELIERTLFLQRAHEEGLSVSDKQLKSRIKAYPVFQQNGVFNPRLYKQVLSYSRISPAEFEEEQRREMLIQQVTGLIRDQAKVTENELREEFRQLNEKIKVKFLLFTPQMYQDQVEVTEEKLNDYFSAHKEEYRQPDRRKVAYLLLKTSKFEEQISITDEEIKKYYQDNQEKYHQPKQVKASHILLKVPPRAGEKKKEEVKKKAQELLGRIKKGENFAKLAREFSEDEGSAKMGGDLGYFGRGRMMPSFEEAAFSLAKDQVSDLVETPYGYHIIKLMDIREEHTSPLETVRVQIERSLKKEQSLPKAEALADEIYLQLDEGSLMWEKAAEDDMWEARETDFFAPEERVSGLGGDDSAFKEMAFRLRQQEVSPPVKIWQGFALLRVVERKDAHLPQLEEVKDKVTRALTQELAGQKARAMAEKAGEKSGQGSSLEQLAKKFNLEVKESKFFNRRGFIPEIGSVAGIAPELFALDKGQFSQPLEIERGQTYSSQQGVTHVAGEADKGKSYALFLLEEKESADEEKLKTEAGELRSRLLSLKQELALQSWVTSLREQAEIEINQKLLD